MYLTLTSTIIVFLLLFICFPVCRMSMDSADIVRGLSGHCQTGILERCPRTMSTESIEIVHGNVHRKCPLCPRTMSTESMDNVHSVHGQCLQSPWTFPFTFYSNCNQSECTHPVHDACHLYFMTYNAYNVH